MNGRARFPLGLLLFAAVGCGEERPTAPSSLRVGTAAIDGTGFQEIPAGADAPLVSGAQGGFHVWVNVRLQGVEGVLRLEREARRVHDDALVLRRSSNPLEVPPEAMNDWWDNPSAVPAFMCPTPIGVRVADEAIRIEVRLLDSAETLLGEGSLVVTPRCPAGDQNAFCNQICIG